MAQPDETDDLNHGPDDVRAAIETLTPPEVYRIKQAAQLCLIGTEFQDADELVNEAVLRSIGGGGRNWPKHVQFVAFMIKTIESISEASRSSPAQARTDRLDGIGIDPNPEAFLASKGHAHADVIEQAIELEETQAHLTRVRDDSQAVDELFANDEDVTWILMGIKDGQKMAEICSISGMSTTQYESAQRRMRRKIASHFPGRRRI